MALPVNEATKIAYKTSSTGKTLVISFPNISLTVPMSQVEQESMALIEKLMDRDVEFVGCYASKFGICLRNVSQDLKGQKIVVTIQASNTEVIPLFTGIVDGVSMKANKSIKQIEAYDELYTKGQLDIASWYNSLTFPISILNFRNSLFQHIGLTQVEQELPNDDIMIKKQYAPKTLQCLPVLKYLCQINGCFGIINRSGNFEYRFIHNEYDGVYPATNLYPENELYPTDTSSDEGSGIADNFAYYKSIDYQEYLVNPVQRLQIRASEDDEGVTVGNPTGNKYIIQNNMFAYGQNTTTLTQMAERIWLKIANITFHPCDTENMGLPYVEVGDVVSYTLVNANDTANTFNVMSRELHGIQGLMDSYTAEGEQDQSEFVTDVQAQIDIIKRNQPDMSDYYTQEDVDDILEDYYTQEETDFAVTEMTDLALAQITGTTGLNIQSVYSLPSTRSANTVYFIQGGIIVIQ